MLKTGTLLIQVVDARRYAVVWQGYASGFHHDRRVPVEKRARKFVRDIFDRYPFFAKNFLTAHQALVFAHQAKQVYSFGLLGKYSPFFFRVLPAVGRYRRETKAELSIYAQYSSP